MKRRPLLLLGIAGVAAGVLAARRLRSGPDWYRTVYRLAYRIGFTPWDRGVPPPQLARFVEAADTPPGARALDLGCGTGTNVAFLARHGWSVTGVDMVAEAVATARERVAQAGLSAICLEGDVTRLNDLHLEPGFRLLVDAGCYHTLPTEMRDDYATGVTSLAAPGATLLLFGFRRGAISPMRSGVNADELRSRFRGWELEDQGPITLADLAVDAPNPTEARRTARAAALFDVRHYRLRRLSKG